MSHNNGKLPAYEKPQSKAEKTRAMLDQLSQLSAAEKRQLNSNEQESDDEEFIGSSQVQFSTPKPKRSFKKKVPTQSLPKTNNLEEPNLQSSPNSNKPQASSTLSPHQTSSPRQKDLGSLSISTQNIVST